MTVDRDIIGSAVSDTKYEVEVPFTGELLLDDPLLNYGPLLYNKEGEIEWKGLRDGKLLLKVEMEN